MVAQGLADAYAAPRRHLEEVQPSNYTLESLYFHLTEEGIRILEQLLPAVWIESDLDP